MMNTPAQAIIFDMDGVLFDTEPLHMLAWEESLAQLGINYDTAFYMDWVGIPDEDLGAWLEEQHADKSPEGGFLKSKRVDFRRIVREKLQSFEGLVDRLALLRNCLPLGVATSSQRKDLELMLSLTGLAQYFSASYTFNDMTQHKPHPEPYLLTAERLGVAPEHCIALEDSPTGVKSAKAAGMLTLGILSSFSESDLAEADHRFVKTIDACDWLLANGYIPDADAKLQNGCMS